MHDVNLVYGFNDILYIIIITLYLFHMHLKINIKHINILYYIVSLKINNLIKSE